MSGYTGKIVRINLTNKKISTIATKDYEQWGGGHGIGSAIFWDLVKDKAISGFDPANVITIMTSPLTGTLAPAGAGRTEVQGIGVQSYPVEWFTRSNLGGRFGAMLKFAGWDGIVIEGRAENPVWIDIRDDNVQIVNAANLWGKDTWQTQEEIWREVRAGGQYEKRTNQKPAVLAIGPSGERLSRIAALIHDAGNAAGQGGFGGVWGSKNLKAVSVIGTGNIKIADPAGLMEARLWAKKNYEKDIENPELVGKNPDDINGFGGRGPVLFWQLPKQSRLQACFGCHSGCRARYGSGKGNESCCMETIVYSNFDTKRHSGIGVKALSSLFKLFGLKSAAAGIYMIMGAQTDAAYTATDLLQKYGINAFELGVGLPYLRDLYKKGALGPGKSIACDLPFEKIGELEFIEKLIKMIAYREGIGNDIAEGFVRASKKWGRLDEDLATGLLEFPHWGLPNHYDPRTEVEWGYGTIMGDRDINEHDFNLLFWMPSAAKWMRNNPPVSAEEITKIFSEKMKPYEDDSSMLDFSTGNIYSRSTAKLVAWHRHYTRFWKQSILYCDFRFPDFFNPNTPDKRGLTGEGEQKFFNAVTGKNISFVDGMEIGRKIWNLDNAIWTMQGRHRNMVNFADYVYKVPSLGFQPAVAGSNVLPYYMPGKENGKWEYIPLDGRCIDRNKFEGWKTEFYKLEGWDPGTGWPTRNTLESMGLGYVADELDKKGKLGRA